MQCCMTTMNVKGNLMSLIISESLLFISRMVYVYGKLYCCAKIQLFIEKKQTYCKTTCINDEICHVAIVLLASIFKKNYEYN